MTDYAWIDAIKLLPLYLLFIATFGSASLEKFRSGGVPPWFKAQFDGTFLSSLPGGISPQYYLIALLEASVVVVFLISLGTMEFLPTHDPLFLKAGLILAMFTFFILGFGLRIAGDYQGAANLFCYFGFTFLFFMYVENFARL